MRKCSLLLMTLVLGCGSSTSSPAPAPANKATTAAPPVSAPGAPPTSRGAPPGSGGGLPDSARGAPQNPPRGAPPGPATRPPVNIVAELEKMPVGLEIIHTPDKVSKVEGPLAGDSPWPFMWRFKTEVKATTERPLTIILFGTLIQDGERWVLPEKAGENEATVWMPKDFIDWYKCPGARVEPGKPVVDVENWSGSRTSKGFKQKWFYVAKDDQDKRYKGEAIVELLPKP